MSTLTLRVTGMTCRHCVRKVTAALRDVPGVQLVRADLTTTTVVLHGDPAVAEVLAALDSARFPGTVVPAARPNPDVSEAPDTGAAGDAPG
jgi:copper chaperone CopZ